MTNSYKKNTDWLDTVYPEQRVTGLVKKKWGTLKTGASSTVSHTSNQRGNIIKDMFVNRHDGASTVDAHYVTLEAGVESFFMRQSNGTQDTSIGLRTGINSNIQLAVKFTTAGAISVSDINLLVKRNGTIATGKNIFVDIQTDATAEPSGTSLLTAVVAANKEAGEINTSFEVVNFDLSGETSVLLAASTVYWLVFTGDYGVSAANYLSLGNDSVGSDGNTMEFDLAWGSLDTTRLMLCDIKQVAWTEEMRFYLSAVANVEGVGWNVPVDQYVPGFAKLTLVVGAGPATDSIVQYGYLDEGQTWTEV